MTTRQEKLSAITKAIDEVVPSYVGECYGIREILLWLDTITDERFAFKNGELYLIVMGNFASSFDYNLHKDSLEEQDDALVSFLYSLI